jgi:hypothetical protein
MQVVGRPHSAPVKEPEWRQENDNQTEIQRLGL